MKLGKLLFDPISKNSQLIAESVKMAVEVNSFGLYVTEINPELADTTAFCEAYDIGMDQSANCVVLEARRAERTWYAACMILATTRVDVNGVVRKYLDARAEFHLQGWIGQLA